MRPRPQSLHGPRGCSAGPQKLRKPSPRSLPERGSQPAHAKAEAKAPGYATLAASELKGKRDRRCCSCNGHEKPHWCLLSPHRPSMHRACIDEKCWFGNVGLELRYIFWRVHRVGQNLVVSSENLKTRPAGADERREGRGQRELKVEAVARAVFRKGRADGRARGGPTERE